ncbi:M15 family metallopeptidase [Lonsdalea quercina]|uniref:M15 family metallopeptidase n=1 Tax=Lonsdalea quercina TaxID=71657 RepID=UPI003976D415
MITHAMLTGKSDQHLMTLTGQHRLQPGAVHAFQALQREARQAGFNLQPASTFRDFERQRLIWNGKFTGQRPLLSHDSQPVDALSMDVPERCETILRWSALPGGSRHHWGTDLDVYDPDRLPSEQSLQLEPWEYESGGYFFELNHWLTEHMGAYDFYRPYAHDKGGVAIEPWHISYLPLAREAMALLSPDIILEAWVGEDVAGYDWLKPHLPTLFTRFIHAVDEA